MNNKASQTELPQSIASLPATSPPLLVMSGIVKRYGQATALQGVNFEARAGEIHALLGENGAGKSTLMHILAGLTTPDAGQIAHNGVSISLPSPRAARSAGIAMVHQHFTLVPAFTVEENLALDTPNAGRRSNYRASTAAQTALAKAASLGWNLNPKARVEDLPVGTQQRVEIVKALATDARLLIFDEPTAVLAGDEVEDLFAVLRQLRDEGRAVILIAHKLAEILAVADRVTVLRRGHNVASVKVADTNALQLAEWMIGAQASPQMRAAELQNRAKSPPFSAPNPVSNHPSDSKSLSQRAEQEEWENEKERERQAVTQQAFTASLAAEAPIFTACNLTVRGDRGEIALRDVHLNVRRGEILGIGGVDGNGQTELAETLAGLRHLESGTLIWQGQMFAPGVRPRTGYIPQDRRRAGLALSLSVEENLLFEAVRAPQYRRGLFLKRRRLAILAQSLLHAYDIRAASVKIPVSALSGGNQQKIVVARALHSEPEWIVAVNPTRGLDIGASRFVHAQLRKARARGAAIVLISTDLDELAALADRQAILSGGALTEYTPDNAAQTGLLLGGLTEDLSLP